MALCGGASPKLNSPIIPAKAGIHQALIWIPAFAGMIGAGRMGNGLFLNNPYFGASASGAATAFRARSRSRASSIIPAASR